MTGARCASPRSERASGGRSRRSRRRSRDRTSAAGLAEDSSRRALLGGAASGSDIEYDSSASSSDIAAARVAAEQPGIPLQGGPGTVRSLLQVLTQTMRLENFCVSSELHSVVLK